MDGQTGTFKVIVGCVGCDQNMRGGTLNCRAKSVNVKKNQAGLPVVTSCCHDCDFSY